MTENNIFLKGNDEEHPYCLNYSIIGIQERYYADT